MNPDIYARFAHSKVLVTGGAGFIGSNLARRLLALGAQVTIVDPLLSNLGGNPFNFYDIKDKIKVVKSDMRDKSLMQRLLPGEDFLFNLAGQVSHLESMEDPQTDLDINTIAQLSLLESCQRWNPDIRILYAGTRQVYGRPRYLPVDESHPLQPVDFNGVSKMAGEGYHLVYQKAYNMQTTSLRLTNVYGPRMRVRDARKTFVGIWFRQLIEGEPITIFGDGSQLRAFNYIDDVVDALLLAACSSNAAGQVYNLGAEPISLLQLARLMVDVNGSGAFRFEPFPPDRARIDIGGYYADISKARSELGWEPVTNLETGIRQTLDFYRQNRKHYFL
jgi:UDP-glucose 4-epimerase